MQRNIVIILTIIYLTKSISENIMQLRFEHRPRKNGTGKSNSSSSCHLIFIFSLWTEKHKARKGKGDGKTKILQFLAVSCSRLKKFQHTTTLNKPKLHTVWLDVIWWWSFCRGLLFVVGIMITQFPSSSSPSLSLYSLLSSSFMLHILFHFHYFLGIIWFPSCISSSPPSSFLFGFLASSLSHSKARSQLWMEWQIMELSSFTFSSVHLRVQ